MLPSATSVRASSGASDSRASSVNVRLLSAKFGFHLLPFVGSGPVHKGMNHVPKAVSEHDSDPFLNPDLKAWFDPLWTQSFLGTWFVRAHLKPCMGQHSRNKMLPHNAQILLVIRIVVAMLVNARSSNQEVDCDPKQLSEHDSHLCEQAQCHLLGILMGGGGAVVGLVESSTAIN